MSHDIVARFKIAGNLDRPGHVVLVQYLAAEDAGLSIICIFMDLKEVDRSWILFWIGKMAYVLFNTIVR
jgi:hypothetical protein